MQASTPESAQSSASLFRHTHYVVGRMCLRYLLGGEGSRTMCQEQIILAAMRC